MHDLRQRMAALGERAIKQGKRLSSTVPMHDHTTGVMILVDIVATPDSPENGLMRYFKGIR